MIQGFLSEDKTSIIENIAPTLNQESRWDWRMKANFTKSGGNTFVTYQVLKISVLAPLKLFSQNEVQ